MHQHKIDSKILEELEARLKEDGIQKVVAGAVIFLQDGKILLLERAREEFKGGLVELPSGAVESGESITDGLAREVKEETGLNIIEIKRYIGSFDYESSSGKKARQLNFAVSVQNGDIRINPSEHSRYHIVHPASESLRELNISGKTKSIILKSLED